MRKAQHKFLAGGLLLGLSACGQAEIGDARYGPDDCRRVALIDAVSHTPIVGAEDFAVDWETRRLFISAYDRRAVEKAARKKSANLPHGGVYVVSLAALVDDKTGKVDVKPLVAPGDISGGLRPHGITYDSENHELVFINRAYERRGRKWIMTPKVQRIGANGEVYVGPANNAHCAANDIVVTGGDTFASFDHGDCGWLGGVEDVLSLKRSGVAGTDNERLFSHASFANGLTLSPGGELVLAATRENALLFMADDGASLSVSNRTALPGGPDNLTVAEDGGVIAAIHPSLRRLAMNRKLGIGKAPSRIVKVDPNTGRLNVLFDDPDGAMFSAATVGLETVNGLIAGSVTDDGVLVCSEAS